MTASSPTAAPFADVLPPGAGAIVIFDGLCHFCDRSVQFMLRHDREAALRFAPSQSPVAANILARVGLPSAPGTIVLVEADRVSLRSTASLRIARRLGLPWSLASVLLWVPASLRDAVYAVVARNRLRWFGRRDTCRIPTPDEARRFL